MHVGAIQTTTKATCTTDGKEVTTCTDCNKVVKETVTQKATGHSWGAQTTTKEPTCCTGGSAEKKCTNAGCSAKDTVPLPATQKHTYGAGCSATKPAPEPEPETPKPEPEQPKDPAVPTEGTTT